MADVTWSFLVKVLGITTQDIYGRAITTSSWFDRRAVLADNIRFDMTDHFRLAMAGDFISYDADKFRKRMAERKATWATPTPTPTLVAPRSRIIAEPSAKAAATHGAGSLIVGTLGVALVAALTPP